MKNPHTNTCKQESLYKEHILPNEERLIDIVREVRKDVDELYEERKLLAPKIPQKSGIQDIHKYPIGHCYEIADKVREGVLEIAPVFFHDFIRNGGLYERNWGFFVGNTGNRMFHNTLQIGTRIYDVCHEEPSGTETQIHVTHISDTRYKLIDTYAHYTETRESYHHCKAYSSEGILNPMFSIVIPIFFETTDGRLVIGDEQSIVKRNADTQFHFGKNFLKQSLQKYPPLPEHTRKNLAFCFEENMKYSQGIEKRSAIETFLSFMRRDVVDFSHTNLRKGIKHWHRFDNYFREHGEDAYHGSQVTITLLRRILRTYNSLLFKGKLPYKPEKNGQNP